LDLTEGKRSLLPARDAALGQKTVIIYAVAESDVRKIAGQKSDNESNEKNKKDDELRTAKKTAYLWI
jgi:hypothetical protein